MAKLLFFDDGHRYTVDGEEVPSVSELTRFLTRELYEDIPEFALTNAASRGTAVHKATEVLDKYGSVECDDDVAGFVEAYVAYTRDNSPDWEKIEWSVCNDKLYAGTVDRYGIVDGAPTLIDIKTTSRITGLHKVLYTAQLNLYRLAVLKEKPVEKMAVLQLKNDGTYKVYDIDVNEQLAQACITMHEAIKNSKRKRRKNNG